jgi:hypothetical protein
MIVPTYSSLNNPLSGLSYKHSEDFSCNITLTLSPLLISPALTSSLLSFSVLCSPTYYRALKPLLQQILFVPLYTMFLGISAASLQSLSALLIHFDSQLQALKTQIKVYIYMLSLEVYVSVYDSHFLFVVLQDKIIVTHFLVLHYCIEV